MSGRCATRLFLIMIVTGTGAGGAIAQSYVATGQVGYLSEWELNASLRKTVTGDGVDYSGPVTLRHVGLCSSNGVEEKSGIIELRTFPKYSRVEGSLKMQDGDCHFIASAPSSYSGLLNCPDAQGIPINFSIGQTKPGDS